MANNHYLNKDEEPLFPGQGESEELLFPERDPDESLLFSENGDLPDESSEELLFPERDPDESLIFSPDDDDPPAKAPTGEHGAHVFPDELRFGKEMAGFSDKGEGDIWKILVVDDDEDVHTVTRLSLEDLRVEGRKLELLSAYSGEEARDIIRTHKDISVILLDVVMESDSAGLDLAEFIRKELGNSFVRIVLRTGQPGYAPERKVILTYDINDYKTKTELTSEKLFTAVTAGIRGYNALKSIYKRNLELKNKVREIRELNEELEARAEELSRANTEIRELNLSLERKVEERTAELNETLRKVEHANFQIMDSIEYAQRIQRSLLPSMEEMRRRLPESFFLWMPKDIVGGDIFIADFQKDSFLVAAIDCTGHGVPGALMTMLASSACKRVISDEDCRNPPDILRRLNVIIQETLQQNTEHSISDDGLDAAICLANPKERVLTFAGARLPLYVVENGDVAIIKGDRQSIGYRRSDPDFEFASHRIGIRPDMRFYLATDGILDQAGGEKGRCFGTPRFVRFLEEHRGETFEEQRESLIRVFEDYKGDHPQRDDITVAGFGIPH